MKTEPLRLIRTTTYVTLVVTCLALCVSYALHGEWIWALAALWLFAIAVPVPDLPPWGRVVSNVTFAGTVILAGNAAVRLGRPFWALIAVTAATATWDLHHFIHRLPASEPAAPELTDPVDVARSAPIDESRLEEQNIRAALIRSHLQRLGTTLGLSLALGSIALVVRVDYSIRTLAVLTLILLVGLGGAVAYLRRVSD
ncbi:MAG: hypothetical protein MUQ30_03985 [Anaerolineae bacterium]|nr:hypothetical protein [Anaerolineae bacterium]